MPMKAEGSPMAAMMSMQGGMMQQGGMMGKMCKWMCRLCCCAICLFILFLIVWGIATAALNPFSDYQVWANYGSVTDYEQMSDGDSLEGFIFGQLDSNVWLKGNTHDEGQVPPYKIRENEPRLKKFTDYNVVANLKTSIEHAYKRSDSSDWSGGFKCTGGAIVETFTINVPEPRKSYVETHSGCYNVPSSPTDTYESPRSIGTV